MTRIRGIDGLLPYPVPRSCSIIAVIWALESHIVLEHVKRFVLSSIIALDTRFHVTARDI